MARAVRKRESITAEEALRLQVIDFVSTDVKQLMEQADNKEVVLSTGKRILKTKGAVIHEKKMGSRQKILATISDPNIAYILFLVGLAGLYFEFANPGVILPGVIGGISLLLAFFSMQTLPVNYAGILLILFGIILFIAELKVISHGILTVGKTLLEAFDRLEVLETCAKMTLIADRFLKGRTRLLNKTDLADIDRLMRRNMP